MERTSRLGEGRSKQLPYNRPHLGGSKPQWTLALAGFATCLAGAVAGMAVAMELKDDPSSSPAMIAVMVPATGGLAVLMARLLRAYASNGDGDRQPRAFGPEPA